MGKWQLGFMRHDSLGWRAVLPTDCRVLVKQITLCRCLEMHCLCFGTIFHCCRAISHWIIKIWNILKRGKRQLGFVRQDSLGWRAVLPTDSRVLVKQSTLCWCLAMHCLCVGTIFHCCRAISHWIIKIWNILKRGKRQLDLWDRILLVEMLFCPQTPGCWWSRVTFSMPCIVITLCWHNFSLLQCNQPLNYKNLKYLKRGKRQLEFVRQDSLGWRAALPTECRVLVKQSPLFDAL